MPSIALVPACALIAGVAAGILIARSVSYVAVVPIVLWAGAVLAWRARQSALTLVCATAGFMVGGVALGTHAAAEALSPSIRTLLERELDAHDPFTIQVRLEEDAGTARRRGSVDARDDTVTIRTQAEAVWIRGVRTPVRGGVRLSIGGATAASRAHHWRAGRRLTVPVTFRRPTRYLNDGVPDFERELALDGIALNAGAKSALLVDVVGLGSRLDEWSADARVLVRSRVSRWIGSRDALAGGIVTAILIGDRTGLPDEVRGRLQAAGTYHVIAISGGNIAILAALAAGMLLLAGISGRWAAGAIVIAVVAYAAVVNAGPSVWRATATAVAYLVARVIDHRTPPWNAMAVSAALLACVAPLDVRDAGFALTFGATAAIVEAAARVARHPPRAALLHRAMWWVWVSVVASAAAEIVLLPIAASVFSRVTCAGLVLNLVAVPLMTVAQVSGLVVVGAGGVDWIGQASGAVAAWAAMALVESARLIDIMPWLAIRVPPPSVFVVVIYYAALAGALWLRPKRACGVAVVVCAVLILTGATPHARATPLDGRLRFTTFDVGQGDALLLQTPGGRAIMVDSGGAGFDGAAFDIGGRVLTPAVWARGVRRLDILAMTHGDPDHIGGGASLIRDLEPRELWEGIPVPRHDPSRVLRSLARDRGVRVVQQLAGATADLDGMRIRVLHPSAPDWERQRIRNDDSLVLEIQYGPVAMLLTGDISAEVERAIVPRLSAARMRILKVAHHGSRTSTSEHLLAAWKPQIAIISCGRGNRFGHPAPQVLGSLAAAGVKVYRTDVHGQITVEATPTSVEVRTFLGGS